VASEKEAAMANRSIALILIVGFLAACAAHKPPTPGDERTAAADDGTGAVVANLWYVPGRALLCGSTAVIAGVVMTVTLGQSYDSASELMHGGCSGPWTLRANDIRQAVP
jgi:hypothetical protein